MRNLTFLIILFSASTSWAQVQKEFEFNFLLLSRQTVNPASLNRHVDELNGSAGTTESLGKVSGASFQSAEALYIPNNELALGLRYTVTKGTASSGTNSGSKLELAPNLNDISAVLKLQTEPKKFQAGLGATIGISTPFSIVGTQGGTVTTYSSENQIVWRGFATGRFNFGRFALHAEGGYLWAKAPELKNGNTTLTHSDGTAVELDMSSVYLGAGIGFQF
jgi:hypothetical protein